MKKFVDEKLEDINQWYEFCRKSQKPYIYLTTREKYAEINWDYMHYNKIHEENIREHLKEMSELFIVAYKSFANKESEFCGSPLVGVIKKILIPDSIHLASELYNIIDSYAIKSN